MTVHKVLYLTSQFPPPGGNSTAFSVQRIKSLQKLGVDVVMVCLVNKTPPREIFLDVKRSIQWIREKSSIPTRTELDGIQVHYVKRFQLPQPIFGWYSHLFLYWQLFGKLKHLVLQEKPAVIVSAWLPSSVVACKLGKYLGIPTLVLAEGSDVNFMPVQHRYWYVARRILNEGAAAQVFVSKALKEQALRVGLISKRMIVIYNGADVEVFSIQRNDPKTNVKNILAVGRLESVKGFQSLIDAFSIISQKYSYPVCLTIVGDGLLKSTLLEQVHRLNLDGKVILVPSMHQSHLVTYYQQANLLCVPSLQESFGCVIVEAMACGTPVVASRVGGITEIVDVTSGILVPPGEPQALADALIDALEKEWDSNLIRERVLSNFTWGQTGNSLMNLIRELITDSISE